MYFTGESQVREGKYTLRMKQIIIQNLIFATTSQNSELRVLKQGVPLWPSGFLGSPSSRIPGFHCQGPGSIPGQGTEIPQPRGAAKKKK